MQACVHDNNNNDDDDNNDDEKSRRGKAMWNSQREVKQTHDKSALLFAAGSHRIALKVCVWV